MTGILLQILGWTVFFLQRQNDLRPLELPKEVIGCCFWYPVVKVFGGNGACYYFSQLLKKQKERQDNHNAWMSMYCKCTSSSLFFLSNPTQNVLSPQVCKNFFSTFCSSLLRRGVFHSFIHIDNIRWKQFDQFLAFWFCSISHNCHTFIIYGQRYLSFFLSSCFDLLWVSCFMNLCNILLELSWYNI